MQSEMGDLELKIEDEENRHTRETLSGEGVFRQNDVPESESSTDHIPF